MSDLLKWAAVVDHSSPQVVAKLLHDQAAELVRLREVCRLAVWSLTDMLQLMDNSSRLPIHARALIDDLTEAGKEPTDGQ